MKRWTGKRTVNILFSLLFAICLLSLASCPDPFRSGIDYHADNLPHGMGSFSLKISGASRTVLPFTPLLSDFKCLELIFSPASGGADKTEVIDNYDSASLLPAVNLEAGTYSLTVNAYKGPGKTNLAAKGTLAGIVISSGRNTSSSVILKALLAQGKGTFTWDIGYPSFVTGGSININPLDAAGAAPPPISLSESGSRGLDSGVYNVTFIFNAAEQSLRWSEVVYIYSSLDSIFKQNFTDDYFNNTHHTVTFVYNNGATADGPQSVLHGGNITEPAPPDMSGHAFEGWYTDSALTDAYVFTAPVLRDFSLYAKWYVPPEYLSDKDRWASWVADDVIGTTTIEHDVDGNNVCTITIGGITQPHNETYGWNRWKATAQYSYTANANTTYEYKFEARTESGSGDRDINFQYYYDEETGKFLHAYPKITEQPATYTVIGEEIPKSIIGQALQFQGADKLGTFYVKIVSIKVVKAIEVASQPKLTYTHGETLDLSGLSVKLTYDDNTAENIPFADFESKGITTTLYNGEGLSRSEHNNMKLTVSVGGRLLSAGTLTVNKAAGEAVGAPTGAAIGDSIKLNVVTAPDSGQTVEYAISTNNDGTGLTWQDGLTFDELSVGTYYLYARSKENGNYNAGEYSVSVSTVNITAEITLSIEIEQIVDGVTAPSLSDNTLSQTGISHAITQTITIAGTYDSIKWEIFGAGNSADFTQDGNATFILDAGNIIYNSLGGHTLRLSVIKDGIPYMVNISFTIVE